MDAGKTDAALFIAVSSDFGGSAVLGPSGSHLWLLGGSGTRSFASLTFVRFAFINSTTMAGNKNRSILDFT
jgi:hypothetical protein